MHSGFLRGVSSIGHSIGDQDESGCRLTVQGYIVGFIEMVQSCPLIIVSSRPL